jgi:hypothetical protein
MIAVIVILMVLKPFSAFHPLILNDGHQWFIGG